MGVQDQYRDYVMTGFVKRIEPVVVDHGEGARLYDVDGKEYLDCFAGISVVNAGHCNPEVIAAAKAQMDKLVHCRPTSITRRPTGALAEKMAADHAPAALAQERFSPTAAPRPSRAR